MNTKIIALLFFVITGVFAFGFTKNNPQQKDKNLNKNTEKATVGKENKDKVKTSAFTKTDTVKNKTITEAEIVVDTVKIDENLKFKFYKKNAHASYYAAKFEGKRTASGKKFSNKGYTAAHKKFAFGTKVKVTNEANGKSVIVEITDRGPYSKAREIDLSKKAFMEIVSNKNSGMVLVKMEVAEK